MNIKETVKGLLVGIVLVAVAGAIVTVGKPTVNVNVPDTQGVKVGSVAGPDFWYRVINFNNVQEWYESRDMAPATTTLCAFMSPSATTSLQFASFQITTGTTKLTLYSPYAFTITDVQASLTQSGTGLSTFNVNKNGTTIFSTKLTIDDSEFHTSTAATPRVISVTSVSAYDKITVDIDGIGNGCTGAKIYILGTRTL